MGFDNAHAVDLPRKGYGCRKVVEYDHKHRHHLDKGVPYEFTDPGQLVADFWTAVEFSYCSTGYGGFTHSQL